ncbi:hypothetical protein [Stenotrophomonas sp. FR012]|uniref:hypothetical protein n=1 Tax=Stenotrophomonas sp. FR012 TaxID=3398457 RepID=UPI0039C71593
MQRLTHSFTLFRVQLHKPQQMPLLGVEASEAQILKAALLEKPWDEVRGHVWRVGNVSEVSSDAMVFFIGKEQPTTFGTVGADGDFHEAEAVVAPNTLVVVDLKYQLLAIAHRVQLSQSVYAVASRIRTLLASSQIVREAECKVSVAAVNDPTDFIRILETAQAVVKFKVTYGLPNVWDADDFQKPMQETTRILGADEGAAVFKGDDLRRGPLVRLAKASSAVGKKAVAWVKKCAGDRVVTVKQKNNPVILEQEIVTEDSSVSGQDVAYVEQSQPLRIADLIVRRMREEYLKIRHE